MLLSLGHVFSLHGQNFLNALSTLKILSSLSMNSPAVSREFSTQLCELCEHALGTLFSLHLLPIENLPDLSQHNPISPCLSVYSSPRPLCLTCFLFLSLSLSLFLSLPLSFPLLP